MCLESDAAEVVNKCVASVFTKEQDSEINVGYIKMQSQFVMKKEMVLRLLQSTKVDKSPGPDGIVYMKTKVAQYYFIVISSSFSYFYDSFSIPEPININNEPLSLHNTHIYSGSSNL